MIALVLCIAAFVLFVLAGLGISFGKLSLGWLGLACIALVALLDKLPAMT